VTGFVLLGTGAEKRSKDWIEVPDKPPRPLEIVENYSERERDSGRQ
jgi:hypothetical protein